MTAPSEQKENTLSSPLLMMFWGTETRVSDVMVWLAHAQTWQDGHAFYEALSRYHRKNPLKEIEAILDDADRRLKREDYGRPLEPPTSAHNIPRERLYAEQIVPTLNDIFIKNYNGKPIDFAMLRKQLYDYYVANVRFKYDWYAPYKFFNDIRILNDTGLKPFAKQMNAWYKDLADNHKCDAEALSDWNCGYTGETHHNLWNLEVFYNKRIGKKQTTKGFQRLLTHITALKEQFKTIPVITNSD